MKETKENRAAKKEQTQSNEGQPKSAVLTPHSRLNVGALQALWADEKSKRELDPVRAFEITRLANRAGEHLLAIEIAERVLKNDSTSAPLALQQQYALALARSGSTTAALNVLQKISATGPEDAETLGMLGRVYKDLAEAASSSEERARLQKEALQLYQRGFERTRSTYCGINAATMAVLTDDVHMARRLAEEVLRESPENDPYYANATRAEAAVILGRDEEAGNLYRRACESAGGRWADIASTKKQCQVLANKLGKVGQFDLCFPVAAVAVFAGHIIDSPNRAITRFPSSAESDVEKRITAWIESNSIRLSFSSAAAGADLLFLRCAQKAGVETHIVLPYPASQFIETSIRPSGDRWVSMFDQVMSKKASLTIVNDQVADNEPCAYDFANRIVAAKARLRASALDLPLKALGVWNLSPGDGRGGVADAAACWTRAKVEAFAIHPTDPGKDSLISKETAIPLTPFERTQSALPTGFRTAVCSILHIFFASYYRLRERQYYAFQKEILETVSKVLATTKHRPESRYGLGADYVFVFEAARSAGLFGLELLQALLEELRRMGEGVMEAPRACLHAGPVLLMVNPVLNQYAHEGAALTRAGRVVRTVEPGIVYCTENFAALSALESIGEFHFEYVGTTSYDVDGGQDRLFSVRFK